MTNAVKPDTTYAWAQSGAILPPIYTKIQEGWIDEYPSFQYFNWIDNRQDLYLQHINQQGIPQWDANTSYVPSGSFTNRNGVIYQCVAPTVGQDPATDVANTYWTLAFQSANGQVVRELGSTTAPTYSFNGYTGTGTYATATTLGLAVNGTTAVTVTSGGISVNTLTANSATISSLTVNSAFTANGSLTGTGFYFAGTGGTGFSLGYGVINFENGGVQTGWIGIDGTYHANGGVSAVGALSGSALTVTGAATSGSVATGPLSATGGTFSGAVTGPSLLNGMALNVLSVPSQRNFGGTYTNNALRPMLVSVVYQAGGASATVVAYVNGHQVAGFSTPSLYANTVFFVVPVGATYSLTEVSSPTITAWNEWV